MNCAVGWGWTDAFERKSPSCVSSQPPGARELSLSEHQFLVAEKGGERSAVDVVEALTEDPFIFCVVDFEAAVWWNALFVVSGLMMRGGSGRGAWGRTRVVGWD
jgi:hypothetical protein